MRTIAIALLMAFAIGAAAPVFAADNGLSDDDRTDELGTTVLVNEVSSQNTDGDAQTVVGSEDDIKIAGEYGVLIINEDGKYTYELHNDNEATNELHEGEEVADVFNYTIIDRAGGFDDTVDDYSNTKTSDTQTLTFNITGTNDQPVLTSVSTSAESYSEADAASAGKEEPNAIVSGTLTQKFESLPTPPKTNEEPFPGAKEIYINGKRKGHRLKNGVIGGLYKSRSYELKKLQHKIDSIETIDGIRLKFTDNSWVLLRPSGTEPVLRVSVEAKTEEDADFKCKKSLDLVKEIIEKVTS